MKLEDLLTRLSVEAIVDYNEEDFDIKQEGFAILKKKDDNAAITNYIVYIVIRNAQLLWFHDEGSTQCKGIFPLQVLKLEELKKHKLFGWKDTWEIKLSTYDCELFLNQDWKKVMNQAKRLYDFGEECQKDEDLYSNDEDQETACAFVAKVLKFQETNMPLPKSGKKSMGKPNNHGKKSSPLPSTNQDSTSAGSIDSNDATQHPKRSESMRSSKDRPLPAKPIGSATLDRPLPVTPKQESPRHQNNKSQKHSTNSNLLPSPFITEPPKEKPPPPPTNIPPPAFPAPQPNKIPPPPNIPAPNPPPQPSVRKNTLNECNETPVLPPRPSDQELRQRRDSLQQLPTEPPKPPKPSPKPKTGVPIPNTQPNKVDIKNRQTVTLFSQQQQQPQQPSPAPTTPNLNSMSNTGKPKVQTIEQGTNLATILREKLTIECHNEYFAKSYFSGTREEAKQHLQVVNENGVFLLRGEQGNFTLCIKNSGKQYKLKISYKNQQYFLEKKDNHLYHDTLDELLFYHHFHPIESKMENLKDGLLLQTPYSLAGNSKEMNKTLLLSCATYIGDKDECSKLLEYGKTGCYAIRQTDDFPVLCLKTEEKKMMKYRLGIEKSNQGTKYKIINQHDNQLFDSMESLLEYTIENGISCYTLKTPIQLSKEIHEAFTSKMYTIYNRVIFISNPEEANEAISKSNEDGVFAVRKKSNAASGYTLVIRQNKPTGTYQIMKYEIEEKQEPITDKTVFNLKNHERTFSSLECLLHNYVLNPGQIALGSTICCLKLP